MIPETGFSTICAMLGLEALHFVVHVDFAVCVTRGQKAERSVDCLFTYIKPVYMFRGFRTEGFQCFQQKEN